MTTNFFQEIAALNVQGDWKMTISTGAGNEMIVSLLLTNEKIGDDARKLIPPMIFKGTAQEIDEAFFTSIEAPAKQTASLFANMEQYMKGVEEAKLQSKMEKDREGKERKEKDERKKKYNALIKKVDELEEAKKYQEAIACLPKEKDYPEQAEEIKKRLESLRQKNGQLTLM